MGFRRYRKIEKDAEKKTTIPRKAESQKRSTRKCVRQKRDKEADIKRERKREAYIGCFEGAWAFSQRVRSERGTHVGDKRETYEG